MNPNRLLASTLTTLVLIGILTMTPANANPAEGTGERSPAANVLVPSASTGRWRGTFCQGWWLGENLTPAIWNDNPERGRRMMTRLVNCVFHRFAPAQVVTALIIADRESGFYPWAQNPSSLCSGIYQHILSAWDSRARTYLWRGWFAPWVWVPSWADPRANIIVAAKMVAAGGWGPWSTA